MMNPLSGNNKGSTLTLLNLKFRNREINVNDQWGRFRVQVSLGVWGRFSSFIVKRRDLNLNFFYFFFPKNIHNQWNIIEWNLWKNAEVYDFFFIQAVQWITLDEFDCGGVLRFVHWPWFGVIESCRLANFGVVSTTRPWAEI